MSNLRATQTIFNRAAKILQRDRAVLRDVELSRQTDYLKDDIAETIVDRFLDIKRKFNDVLDLGSGCGHIIKALDKDLVGGRFVMFDESKEMLNRDKSMPSLIEPERIVGDLEKLPFAENSFDAVVSSMSLHWVNDLLGTLIQTQRSLRPDGVFIGAILGGDTLYELRTAFQLAETERDGGISPHVSPMVQHQDVGSLLSRAGFSLTTVDIDERTIMYPSVFELMEDLQAMGESNAVLTRKSVISKDLLMATNEAYKAIYGKEDGSIPATFQIIYLIGWKPDPSQPKALKRGSATHSLKDLEQMRDPNTPKE